MVGFIRKAVFATVGAEVPPRPIAGVDAMCDHQLNDARDLPVDIGCVLLFLRLGAIANQRAA